MKRLFTWLEIVAVVFAALALVVPALPQNPQTQTAPLYAVNAKYTNGTTPGYWPTQQSIPNGSGGTIAAATGLNINIGPGTANCGSGNIVTYAGGTVALTASATNMIYLNTSASCAPAVKTSAFTGSDIPIAVVVTSGTAITSTSDVRTWASVPPSTSSTTVGSNDGSVQVTNNSGAYDLHVLTTQCYLGVGGLTGAFTNSSGVVKLPLCIGNGPVSFTVPTGADRLKLGINDDFFSDNIGSLTIHVSKNGASPSSVSVAGNVMPWSPTTNPALTFGVNDGASPVDAITGLSAGDTITISYVSGTVKMNSTFPFTDADGYLTNPPAQAGEGGATGSATSLSGSVPPGTFFPTKYTVSAINTAMLGLKGDVSAQGPSYPNSLVIGINGVPLCTGFAPINGQTLTYTTALSPNPCYTGSTPGSGFVAGGDLIGSSTNQTVASLQGATLAAPSLGYLFDNGSSLSWVPIPNGLITTSTSPTITCGQWTRLNASGAITVNLPAPSAASGSCSSVIERGVSAGAISITTASGTYDGASSNLQQGQAMTVWTDGTNWHSSSPIVAGVNCTWTGSLTGNTINCSGGGDTISSPNGTLSVGGTPTSTTLDCVNASTSQYGCVEPDGVTTGISGGKLVAIGAAPSGAAGGDLSGTYPNPTVAKVNGGSIPISAGFVGTDSSGRIVASSSPTPNLLYDLHATGAPLIPSRKEYFPVTGGNTYTIFSSTGAGVVDSIWMSFNCSGAYHEVGPSLIKVTINGEGSPYISVPVASFFQDAYLGNGGASSPVNIMSKFFKSNALSTSAGNVAMMSRLKIPFSNGITITVTPANSCSGGGMFWMVHGDAAPNTWQYTRKLWIISKCFSSSTVTELCGTATDAAPASYKQEEVFNFYSATQGQYAGGWLLNDDTPGGLSPKGAGLEGNVRLYVDTATAVWAASTALSAGTTIMDPYGNQQTWSGGTTGSSKPASFGCNNGDTTSDGTGTWTAQAGEPWTTWFASKAYSLACMSVYDSSGNYALTVTTPGTTSTTQPTCTSNGQVITDGTVTWKCSTLSSSVRAAITSSGTEDYYFSSSYGSNEPVSYGPAVAGMPFVWVSGSGTVGYFRYFTDEAIRFNHFIAMYRELGESNTIPITSGTESILHVNYIYNEDTN